MGWSNRRMMQRGTGGSGGGGAALPQLGSLVARFSADTITPQTDNTTLTSNWVDSISGIVATTQAGTPLYRAARTGGKPSIQFPGASSLSIATPGAIKTAADSQICTVVIAFSNVAATGNGMLFGASTGSDSFCFQANASVVGRFDGLANAASLTMVPLTDTGFHVMGYTGAFATGVTGGGYQRTYVDGGAEGGRINKGPVTTTATFGIGARDGINSLPCKADIYEVLVWNTELSPLDMLKVQAWMCAKYAQPLPWASATSFDIYNGDSLTLGVGSGGSANAYPSRCAAARSKGHGQWTNIGIGGIQTVDLTTRMAEWSGIAAYLGLPVKYAIEEWYNENAAAKSAATIYADMVAHCTAARAIANLKLCLLSSTSTSLDPGTSGNARAAYDVLLDANFASISDAYVALHNDTSIGISTAYATNGAGAGLNLFSDGVHLNAAGYAIKAPLVTAGMNAI